MPTIRTQPTSAATSTSECNFVKTLLQHFTPSPMAPPTSTTTTTIKSLKPKHSPRVIPSTTRSTHRNIKPTTTTSGPLELASSCRQCLHMCTQLNSLRQKLRSAHAAYTASRCQDERTFANIPMMTVRSYRPHRQRPVTTETSSSSSSSGSLKLEIRRNEPVNALFMADDKWVYVKTSDERRGFIPAKCCQPFALFALNHSNHVCGKQQTVKNEDQGFNVSAFKEF